MTWLLKTLLLLLRVKGRVSTAHKALQHLATFCLLCVCLCVHMHVQFFLSLALYVVKTLLWSPFPPTSALFLMAAM